MMFKKAIFLLIFFLLITSVLGQRYGESDDFSYALKLFNEGFYDIAAQQFGLFVNRYPDSERIPEAKYYLGLSLYNAKDYENARIEFQSMAVSFPEHDRAPEAWEKVGTCYLRIGKMQEAARAFETVKILYPRHPNAPGALYEAAKIYYHEDLYEKAELTLKDFLDRYPDSEYYPNGRLLFGDLLLTQQNFDRAYQEYEKVLKSDATPDIMAQAYLGMGRFYSSLGQFEKAKTQYKAILNQYGKSPAVFEAVYNYSRILAVTEDYQTAINLLNEHLSRFRLKNQEISLKLNLAAVHYLRKEYFQARKLLESISTASADDTLKGRLRFYLAATYLQEEKYEKSIQIWKEFLEDESSGLLGDEFHSEARKQFGYAHLKKRQYEQGSAVLKQYLAKNSSSPAVEKVRTDLFYAALQNNKLQEAGEIYQNILAETADHPLRDEILFSLIKKLFSQKQYDGVNRHLLNFFRDYRCSAKYDSAEIYFSILHHHFLVNQDMGVSRLAKIVGRVLGNENKEKMQLELADVYLKQLKDLDEAIRISQSIIATSTDSSVLGRAYHIMGESYRRKSQLASFSGIPDNTYHSKAQDALQKSMAFLNFIEKPDSVSFLFLLETAGPQIEGIPTQKKIQFWEHFQSNYPESYFAEKAAVILGRLYLKADDTEMALRELAPLRNSEDEKIAGNAYFNMGKIYYERNELNHAAENLKEFLLQIKAHHFRANGFGLLAKIREKQGNYQEAAQFWARLRDQYDYAPAAIAAETQIPEIFLKAEQYQAVIDYTKPYTNFTVSEDLIVRELQQIPESAYYFFQGKALSHLSQFSEGRQKLLDYLYFNTDDKYRDESLFTLAQIALEEDDQNGALLHLDMIARNPNSPFFLQATARAADIYFDQKNYDEAQNLYSQLIEKTGNTEQSIPYMAKEMICLINQGQLKSFDSRLSSFKKIAGDDANYRNYRANFEFEIGKYYYQNKNFNSAIDRFQRIIDDYKKSDFADDAEYYLGLTYTTLNKVDQAMQVLSRFVEKYPDSPLRPNIYVTLGGLYYRAEKRNLAVGSFQKAVEIAREPETRKLALSNLISLYRDLGLWDGVLSQARVYAEEFPNAEDLIDKKIVIGTALIHLNRYSEAIDHLKDLKFQANSDQEPEIQFYIGEAYFNAGQYENAIREFVKIPLLSKQTKLQWEASALYYSGQAYEKMGRTNDAIRMYQEIVERPGILVDLKREAQKRIDQLKSSG